MKTEAIIFEDRNKVNLTQLTLDEMANDDVLIDVEYSFISPGTERWCLQGNMHYGQEADNAFPFVPGYQHVGTIQETGKNVSSVKVGDKVFSSFNRFIDMNHKWGGHSSISLNKEDFVYRLPENIDPLAASALVLAQVGYNGASRPPVTPGDIALVMGDGLIGQFVAQTLRMRGAYVIITGKGDAKRMEYARKFSCDMTIDTAKQDLKTELSKIAPDGVKIAVEAIGVNNNLILALDLLAYNGHLVLNGFYPHTNTVDLNKFSLKEITIYNPADFRRQRMEATLDLIDKGKLKIAELITHIIKPEDAPQAYNDLLIERKFFSLGIAIDWRNNDYMS